VRTQAEKGRIFRALHGREGAFIIPNPYDAGTARLLEHLGFEALATTSAGFAFSIGQLDNTVGRDRMLVHVEAIASATELPVSADLEHGYGHDPETVAKTVLRAAAAGLVGCSIEDDSQRKHDRLYELAHAVDRVRAAAEVAHSLPFPFTLTARAENFIAGHPDLADTIRRLQAYQEAGADVLFAPGLANRDDITAVVRAVDRPVNVVMGLQGVHFSLEELAGMGVKRVSVGSSLTRAALGGFIRAAREMRERGTFTYVDDAATSREIADMFGRV
jgi:2-methylisocitrate lyase-like PEP mutase family enzyme